MLYDNPELAAALLVVLTAIVVLQRRIGPRTRWPNRFRRAVWPPLNPWGERLGKAIIGRPRPFVREKDAGEYVCSVNCSLLDLQLALHRAGYRRNLLSTLKFILLASAAKAWERGSWAVRESLRAKYKHHTYFFDAGEQGWEYHLNGHKEINELYSPSGHMGSERYPGDPDHKLRDALDAAGITWAVLENPNYA